MFTTRNHEYHLLFSLRWAARSMVIFCIGILLFFFLSLGLDLLYIAGEDMVVMLLLLLAFLAGLMLAWLDEVKEGCALAILSAAVFYLSYGSTVEGSISRLLLAVVLASPALLFLLYGAVASLAERKATAASGHNNDPAEPLSSGHPDYPFVRSAATRVPPRTEVRNEIRI